MFHEYPSIQNSSKAPRQEMIAFNKLDGSNIRIKFSQKKGFHMFGTRTNALDASHPQLGSCVQAFKSVYEQKLTDIIKSEFRNEREVTAYGEFQGPSSFAGVHDPNEPKTFVLFDLLVGHKEPKFLLPQDFISLFSGELPIPEALYRGILNDEFIAKVRAGEFNVKEGVVCKGVKSCKYSFGGVWMAKVKTQAYLDSLLSRFGTLGLEKYGE